MKSLLLALLIFSAGLCSAGGPRFKVALRVNSKDDVEWVSSILRRELRSLADVEVVDEQPGAYVLDVSSLPITLSNEVAGYALSAHSLWLPDSMSTWRLFQMCGATNRELFALVTNNLSEPHFVDSSLSVVRKSELKAKLEKVVGEFDTRTLEPTRRLLDALEKESSKRRIP